MRKVSFVFFGLAFVIALYTYGVPFLSRPQAPACPRPTPIPGKNTYPHEWSEEQKDTVREAIRCLLPIDKTYQARVVRRQGSPKTEAILLALQSERANNPEWKASFLSSLEDGEKPPYPPTAIVSREEFDSAYDFTDCFYQCNKFEVDISALDLETGKLRLAQVKHFPL
jgi:hypothetical protein